MRKVWLSFITIIALIAVMALPAFAGCNNSFNWGANNRPALTQPNVPFVPGYQNGCNGGQCQIPGLGNIIRQFQNMNGFFGNNNCSFK